MKLLLLLQALSALAVRLGDHEGALSSIFNDNEDDIAVSNASASREAHWANGQISSHHFMSLFSLDNKHGMEFLGLSAGNMAKGLVQKLDDHYEMSQKASLLELNEEEREAARYAAQARRSREALRAQLLGEDDTELGRTALDDLKKSDVVIQHAVLKALDLGEGKSSMTGVEEFLGVPSDATKWKLYCASNLRFHKHVEPASSPVESADAGGDEKEAVATDFILNKHQQAVSKTEEKKGLKQALKKVMDEVWKKLYELGKQIYHFFFEFIKWEIQLIVVDSNVVEMGSPQLAFKCQPLHTCMEEIYKMGKAFMQLIATLIWAIFKVLGELLMAVARQLGTHGSLLQHVTGTTDLVAKSRLVDQDGGLLVHLKGQGGGSPPADSVDHWVKEHIVTEFIDTSVSQKMCANGCQARIKGLFKFDLLSILQASFGNIFASIHLGIGTVPQPLSSYFAMKCTACFDMAKNYFMSMFRGKAWPATKKYFAPGTCNAHTVGMCMMLQKHLTCNYTFSGNKVSVDDRKDKGKKGERNKAYTNMKDFCTYFKNTNLELIKVNGKVKCLRPYNEEMRQRGGPVVHSGAPTATIIDLGVGCEQVVSHMKNYNYYCETPGGNGRGAGGYMPTMFGGFTFKEVVDFNSQKDVAKKCRQLYGCTDNEDKEDFMDAKDNRVHWPDLHKQILSLVSRVDDYGTMPQSFTPEKASAEVFQLLGTVNQQIQSFEGEAGKKMQSLVAKSIPWGEDLENIFAAETWDDKCMKEGTTYMDSAQFKGAFKSIIKELRERDDDPNMKTKSMAKFANAMEVHSPDSCKALVKVTKFDYKNVNTKRSGPLIEVFMSGKQAKTLKTGKMWEKSEVVMEALGSVGGKVELMEVQNKWYLRDCTLRIGCGGAKVGAIVDRMRVKEATQEGKIDEFVDKLIDYNDALSDLSDKFVDGFDSDHKNLPTDGNAAFRKCIEIVEELRQGAKEALRNQMIGADLFPSQKVAKLEALLESSTPGVEALNTFFQSRGWVIEDIQDPRSEEKMMIKRVNGVSGGPLTTIAQVNRMLKLLDLPLLESMDGARDAMFDMGSYFFEKSDDSDPQNIGEYQAPDMGVPPRAPDPFKSVSGHGLVKVSMIMRPLEEARADRAVMQQLMNADNEETLWEEREDPHSGVNYG